MLTSPFVGGVVDLRLLRDAALPAGAVRRRGGVRHRRPRRRDRRRRRHRRRLPRTAAAARLPAADVDGADDDGDQRRRPAAGPPRRQLRAGRRAARRLEPRRSGREAGPADLPQRPDPVQAARHGPLVRLAAQQRRRRRPAARPRPGRRRLGLPGDVRDQRRRPGGRAAVHPARAAAVGARGLLSREPSPAPEEAWRPRRRHDLPRGRNQGRLRDRTGGRPDVRRPARGQSSGRAYDRHRTPTARRPRARAAGVALPRLQRLPAGRGP